MTRGHLLASYLLRKEAGVGKGLYAAGKGFLRSGHAIADEMARAGVKSPTALAAAKVAPLAITAIGAKKGYDSPTGQKLRYKYHVWKQRRAMRRQMEGRR